MKKKYLTYLISVAIAIGIGSFSALLTKNSMQEFNNVSKPALTPPEWLFPIIWSILYVLMGISAAIIWNSESSKHMKSSALKVYAWQLVYNFFWSIWFFNFNAYFLSFIWLIIMWTLIIIMIKKFSKISKLAAFLQIPYLLWVTFAGYLNLGVYLLNRK